MGYFTNLLNFEQQLGFYAAYHHNPLNKFIHVIFVPTLMWTVLVWLFQFPFHPSMPLYCNAAALVASLYGLYYLLLEPIAGLMFAPVLAGLVYAAGLFRNHYGTQADLYVLYIHLFSWAVQFLGHGLFEKRAPALLDSLLQAFLMAPLFVWMEILFLFGYRPKLYARLEQKAQKDIADWKKKSNRKQSNASTANTSTVNSAGLRRSPRKSSRKE